MRILLDECLPRDLKLHLTGYQSQTVQEVGWSGKKNGSLLDLAEEQFDVLLTVDQGFPYQQVLTKRRIAVVILAAKSNKLEHLLPLIPMLDRRLRSFTSASDTPFIKIPP